MIFFNLPGITKNLLFIKKFNKEYQPFLLELTQPDAEDKTACLLYPQFPSSVCDGPLSFAQDQWARENLAGIKGVKEHYVCEWHVQTREALEELFAFLKKEAVMHTLHLETTGEMEQIYSYQDEQAVRRRILSEITLPEGLAPAPWSREAEVYLSEDSRGITVDIQVYRPNFIWGSLLPYLEARSGDVFPFLQYVKKGKVPKEAANQFLRSLAGSLHPLGKRTYGNIVFSDIPFQFEPYTACGNIKLIEPRAVDEIVG